jgi:hypothetical protein
LRPAIAAQLQLHARPSMPAQRWIADSRTRRSQLRTKFPPLLQLANFPTLPSPRGTAQSPCALSYLHQATKRGPAALDVVRSNRQPVPSMCETAHSGILILTGINRPSEVDHDQRRD